MVKKFQLAAFAFMVSFVAFAHPVNRSDDPEKATQVKEQLEPLVMLMEGVNGIGVTGCDPVTGTPLVTGDFVHCVKILTETEEAYKTLLDLYPVGSTVDDIFITVENVGPIGPQPNASGGN